MGQNPELQQEPEQTTASTDQVQPTIGSLTFTKEEAESTSKIFSRDAVLQSMVQKALEPVDIPEVDLNSPANQQVKPSIDVTVDDSELVPPPTTPETAPEIPAELAEQVAAATVSIGETQDNGAERPLGSGSIVHTDDQNAYMVTSVHNIAEFLGLSEEEVAKDGYIEAAKKKLDELKASGSAIDADFEINGQKISGLHVEAVAEPNGGEQVLLKFAHTADKDYKAMAIASGSVVEEYGANNTRTFGSAGYTGFEQQLGIDGIITIDDANTTITADEQSATKTYNNVAAASNADVQKGDSGGTMFSYYFNEESGQWVVEHTGTVTARSTEAHERAFFTKNSDVIVDSVRALEAQ